MIKFDLIKFIICCGFAVVLSCIIAAILLISVIIRLILYITYSLFNDEPYDAIKMLLLFPICCIFYAIFDIAIISGYSGIAFMKDVFKYLVTHKICFTNIFGRIWMFDNHVNHLFYISFFKLRVNDNFMILNLFNYFEQYVTSELLLRTTFCKYNESTFRVLEYESAMENRQFRMLQNQPNNVIVVPQTDLKLIKIPNDKMQMFVHACIFSINELMFHKICTKEDIESLEPYIFIGVPSYTILKEIACKSFNFFSSEDKNMTDGEYIFIASWLATTGANDSSKNDSKITPERFVELNNFSSIVQNIATNISSDNNFIQEFNKQLALFINSENLSEIIVT